MTKCLCSTLTSAVAAVVLSLVACGCSASSQTGTVSDLSVRDGDGLVAFVLSGTRSAKPGCATYNYWIIRDETSLAGKQQIAILMAARLSGKPVSIWGHHSCTRWGDGESVNQLTL